MKMNAAAPKNASVNEDLGFVCVVWTERREAGSGQQIEFHAAMRKKVSSSLDPEMNHEELVPYSADDLEQICHLPTARAALDAVQAAEQAYITMGTLGATQPWDRYFSYSARFVPRKVANDRAKSERTSAWKDGMMTISRQITLALG